VRVSVVGGGLMGSGIAEVCARSGLDVTVVESDDERAERSRSAIERSLARGVKSGKLPQDERDAALERLAFTSALDDVEGSDIAIEAIIESEAAKRDIFQELDRRLPDAQFLASNTSSVPIMKLAAGTSRPERVLGLHFFNPVPVLPLVEVIRAEQTSDETATAIVDLARDLGKTPAQANDFPGFVSNRILMPFVNEAAYALMEGVAEAEAIDTVAKLGFAHPMGPLALADLIGLDTCVAIMQVLHEGLGDPKYAPCPLLRRYVAAGRLGRKTGRGFYEYA
jgi:3-hydroxybutyryl-CoA dehydrogenase